MKKEKRVDFENTLLENNPEVSHAVKIFKLIYSKDREGLSEFFGENVSWVIVSLCHRLIIKNEPTPEGLVKRHKAEVFNVVDRHLEEFREFLDDDEIKLFESAYSTLDKIDIVRSSFNKLHNQKVKQDA